MGLIKSSINAISGTLADSWLEAISSGEMSNHTLMSEGVQYRKNDKRFADKKGTENIISNGSKIIVNEGQCLIVVDGGKIIDFTSEPGYYTFDKSSSPSIFSNGLISSVKESWERFKFAGTPSKEQRAYFINLQEIRDIKFGTPSPVNYFDEIYNAELFLRSFGTYSIKIVDPLKFYINVAPRLKHDVLVDDVKEQLLNEFLTAFSSSLNKLSADGVRISHVVSKTSELAEKMKDILDDSWKEIRGLEIIEVGIASISYDDYSKDILKIRNEGAMLSDPSIREGFVQGAMARGIEAAGSNANGATNGFLGLGLGMNSVNSASSNMSNANLAWQNLQNKNASEQQLNPQQDNVQETVVTTNTTSNHMKFCPQCGTKLPENVVSKFCPECGSKL